MADKITKIHIIKFCKIVTKSCGTIVLVSNECVWYVTKFYRRSRSAPTLKSTSKDLLTNPLVAHRHANEVQESIHPSKKSTGRIARPTLRSVSIRRVERPCLALVLDTVDAQSNLAAGMGDRAMVHLDQGRGLVADSEFERKRVAHVAVNSGGKSDGPSFVAGRAGGEHHEVVGVDGSCGFEFAGGTDVACVSGCEQGGEDGKCRVHRR
jgi:hypothetical protein